jgi:hypothetical protein
MRIFALFGPRLFALSLMKRGAPQLIRTAKKLAPERFIRSSSRDMNTAGEFELLPPPDKSKNDKKEYRFVQSLF